MDKENADYKKMYLKMVNAADDAINILIKAMQLCEDLYIGGAGEETEEHGEERNEEHDEERGEEAS